MFFPKEGFLGSSGIDKVLLERLYRIEQRISILREKEEKYLHLEAHKKVVFANLYISAHGKSIAEKENNAYASDEWKNFAEAHAIAFADYNQARREHELSIKAYDAAHLTLKTESPIIKRQ